MAADWPADLARRETEIAGDEPLRIIGDAADILSPAPEIRDLCDIGGMTAQIALTLSWAAKGMGDAYAAGDDQLQAKDAALKTLRRAQADLGALIDDLAELRVPR